MAYGAQGARRLDLSERTGAQQDAQPVLDVIEGGGADALVRRGVAPRALARIRAVIIVAFALTVIGVARVSITTATVRVLRDNRSLDHAIEEAQETNSRLRTERSVLSSSSRIDRIAQQNYGMVPAQVHEVLDIPAERAEQKEDGTAAAEGSEDGEPTDDPEAMRAETSG